MVTKTGSTFTIT